MRMSAILCQIEAIRDYCLDDSRKLSGLDIGDLRDIAIHLQMVAKVLHADVDERMSAPIPTGGILAGLLKPSIEGGAA